MSENMDFIGEEWRLCKQCSDYKVSNYAIVKEVKTDKFVQPHYGKGGVLYVPLKINGRTEKYRLDEIVAGAFLGEQPPRTRLIHKDGNESINYPRNLAWVKRMDTPLPKHISYETPVRCIETGKEYESIYECSEDMGISIRKIIQSMRNTQIGVKYEYTFELLD